MARSQVQGQTKQSQSQVSMTRTSKTGWVQDSFHPAIGKLSERIKKITGLLTNTYYDEAELLQVWKILKLCKFLIGFSKNWHQDQKKMLLVLLKLF